MELIHIRERLGAYAPKVLPVGNLSASAVLVPLLEAEDGLEVLFTLRPADLPSHGGQVSFPGGRVAGGDENPWATALRESEEELGVDPSAIERLGVLDDYQTITHYHVTPCVGLLRRGLSLSPDPREVEEVFTVPLAIFKEPARLRTMMSGRTGQDERIFFYLTQPHVVWGATAAMLTNFLNVLAESV